MLDLASKDMYDNKCIGFLTRLYQCVMYYRRLSKFGRGDKRLFFLLNYIDIILSNSSIDIFCNSASFFAAIISIIF